MKKILLIEDESALQSALTKVLREEDYVVLSALDGETGLMLAKKELPSLILLDLVLPKKSGFSLLGELRKIPATRDIPVFILSNLEGSDNVEHALELGATTYLVKSNYQLEDIVSKIKDVLKDA